MSFKHQHKKWFHSLLGITQEFDVPQSGFPLKKVASNILAKDLHLNEEEKKLKKSIQATIQQLEKLIIDLQLKSLIISLKFDVIMTLQRENLKQNVDEIALKTIDQVNEGEKYFNSKSLLEATPIELFGQLNLNKMKEKTS